MIPVFISSTGLDLADYRQAAIDTCLRLGFHPIAMEYFEAMDIGATEGSKSKLRNAQLYLGIFAHRYGYIEHGQTQSVTEIEFEYAGNSRISRLCFLVDPHYPWPPDAIDYEHYPLLEDFKARLNKILIRAYFTSVEDFTSKLMQALIEWKPRTNEALPPPTNPFPLRTTPTRPTLMLGREDNLNDLKTKLGILSSSQYKKESIITVIRGWPGVGKTTLVTALAYDSDLAKMYPDGVLWTHLGENPSPIAQLASWARQLGVGNLPTNLEDAISELRSTMRDKRLFIIVMMCGKPTMRSPSNKLLA